MIQNIFAHQLIVRGRFLTSKFHWLHLQRVLNVIRYYTLTDLAPVHFAATALYPEMKFRYFETEWNDRPDWITNAKAEVQRLWQSEYKPEPLTTQEAQLRVTQYVQGASTMLEPSGEPSDFRDLPHWKRRKRARLAADDNDELDRYLMRDTEDELPPGPLSYWQEHSNDIQSNNVAKMALEVFSIPAMSADPERLFSR